MMDQQKIPTENVVKIMQDFEDHYKSDLVTIWFTMGLYMAFLVKLLGSRDTLNIKINTTQGFSGEIQFNDSKEFFDGGL